jgi:hypothetical protein
METFSVLQTQEINEEKGGVKIQLPSTQFQNIFSQPAQVKDVRILESANRNLPKGDTLYKTNGMWSTSTLSCTLNLQNDTSSRNLS